MPDQDQGMGALLLEAMFIKYDKISSSITTDTIPKFKNFVKTIAIIIVIAFIVSLGFVAIGTANDTKVLTVFGRIGLILTGVVFFFMAAPIGFLFVGHRYVTFIRSFAVYQLLITLVIWISPMPVTASLLFGLSFAGGFLALVNVLESDPGITRVITTLIFAGLLATIYFPSIRGKFDSQIVAMNEPSIVQIYPGDLKSGKIKLFLSGKPNKWYSLTPEGKYELFDLPGHNDLYQDELKPVTSEIARKLIDNENLLSRRNLQNNQVSSVQVSIPLPPHTTQKATQPTWSSNTPMHNDEQSLSHPTPAVPTDAYVASSSTAHTPWKEFSSTAHRIIANDVFHLGESDFEQRYVLQCVSAGNTRRQFNGYGITSDVVVVTARFQLTATAGVTTNGARWTKSFDVSETIPAEQFQGLSAANTVELVVEDLKEKILKDPETRTIAQNISKR